MENNSRRRPASPAYGPRVTDWRRAAPVLSPSRARVLDLLRDQPEPCTVAALAALSHQHPNTVREHLDGLVASGLAERTRAATSGRGRPAWLYASTEEATLSPGARQYADLAIVLAEQLAEEDRSLDRARAAGRRWGSRLASRRPDAADRGHDDGGATGHDHANDDVAGAEETAGDEAGAPGDAHTAVVHLLTDLGFAPEQDTRPGDGSAGGTTSAQVVHLRRCPLLEAAYQHPDIVCSVHTGLVEGALAAAGDRATTVDLEPFAEPGACRLTLCGCGRPH